MLKMVVLFPSYLDLNSFILLLSQKTMKRLSKVLSYWNSTKYQSQRRFFEKSKNDFKTKNNPLTQPTITCSKLTIETLEQVVKYAQSQQ